MDKDKFKEHMLSHLHSEFGKSFEKASEYEFYQALSRTVMEALTPNWERTREAYSEGRQVHYFSAEFLVGRSLENNLINLGILEPVKELVEEMGHDFNSLLEEERDPGLGNGGLGRLAACFMDSSATKDLPVVGHGLLYRYGLFRQEIENGFQKEYPDSWMEWGYPFIVPRREDTMLVHYDDMDVYAVPYDMPISGYDTNNVNTLRLWRAEPAEEFDFNLFNSQRFDDAVIERNRVQDITRVLYPNDTSYDGKVLRVRQQYFFVSASLQVIVRNYREKYGSDFSRFAEHNRIQLNDTHPVLAIPELMRLLIDENKQSWEEAWNITCNTFAFTNHTIMSEALETWNVEIFRYLFPRILTIVEQIDEQFEEEMAGKGLNQQEVDQISPIHDGKVHMAYLAAYACFSINGVAQIHSNLIKDTVFKPFYDNAPEKFNNKTNGVTPRRWLKVCNPELSDLLTELLGSDRWVRDMNMLRDLESYVDDTTVMRRLLEIKDANKERLISHIQRQEGINLDSKFIFDVQIKRLHEYKRQLLNALEIVDRYFQIKENPKAATGPAVAYIVGAKAAPGYFNAKAIIKFINEIAKLINSDSDVNEHMQVVFLHNYNVSYAEKIFPAADISEQISTVGMEASGTGNMKFMMNGALTLGTYDGANLEILSEVGEENSFMFGTKLEDFPETKAYYNAHWQYKNIPGLKRAVDILVDGTITDSNTGMFKAIHDSLLRGTSSEMSDPYYVLGDFDDFRNARQLAHESYNNSIRWAQMCWINICRSGRFSSDRTISDYSQDIWKITENKLII
ncbi:MAG: glycogen/starch/alpha-glucan phosphorylase [Eubacteriales bacterium]|nr:glycogen/starch/alpha-glucan phosphorylase [Eubacteriales bacterium]